MNSSPKVWANTFLILIVLPLTSVFAAENLALGKMSQTSTAIRAELDGDKAVDGNPETRWINNWRQTGGREPNPWIYIDLGDRYLIERIELHWHSTFASGYDVQVSNDAAIWTTVFSETNGNGNVDNLLLQQPENGRYVRIFGTEYATRWGVSLYEIGVYGRLSDTEHPTPGFATVGDDGHYESLHQAIMNVSAGDRWCRTPGSSVADFPCTIKLSAGVHDLGAQTLTIPDRIILQGAGAMNSEVRSSSSLPDTHTLLVVGKSVEIRDISIDGAIEGAFSSVFTAIERIGEDSDALVLDNVRFTTNETPTRTTPTAYVGVVVSDSARVALNNVTMNLSASVGAIGVQGHNANIDIADSIVAVSGGESSGVAVDLFNSKLGVSGSKLAADAHAASSAIICTNSSVTVNDSSMLAGADFTAETLVCSPGSDVEIARSWIRSVSLLSDSIAVSVSQSDKFRLLWSTVEAQCDEGCNVVAVENAGDAAFAFSQIKGPIVNSGSLACVDSIDGRFKKLDPDCQPVP